MKLSKLLNRIQEALEKYGDLDTNAIYLPGDQWMPLYDYDNLISYDEEENGLLLNIG